MTYEAQRKCQLMSEIAWLKEAIKKAKKPRHIKELEHQLKQTEYNLYLGVFDKKSR